MKILLVTQNFYPEIGSGANRFRNLYKHLSGRNQVDVLTTHPAYPNAHMYEDKKFWYDEAINQSTDIHRIPMKTSKQSKSMVMRLLYYFELGFKVRRLIKQKQQQYDILYVTTPNIFMPWAAFFGQKHTTKRVLEVRDLWPDSLVGVDKLKSFRFIFPVLKLLEKRMYRVTDAVIINNEGFRAHIKRLAPKVEQHYFPNAFNQEEISFSEVTDDFKVIYTGNIGFAQSYDQLVEVARGLEARKIHFNAVVYGMNAHNFIDYIEAQPFNYVKVYPEKSRQECLSMIRTHNIQLSLMKETETFLTVLPGKIIDGIGCGVPVVTNLGGYANQLINDNNVGFAKERATTEEILQAIEDIKNDHALEQEMRQNARALVQQEFLWERNIEKLNQVLAE
ncbi:glycosyltransferase WbuB [Macrococcus hajekii]|uniref:Glycosyltransferase WbuB n=1 Tax=Macrococcus hajekii TaxID=198482 RepID=A0A4R6BNF1_9STAP|nr:glycosyltransferase family 4 protein [Macrococcus hajekii]TDM03376.1 glycosyltransferase WbuB [Macrococcus hajekii]GGA98350.1 glycosyltransferase WbuB [Macrococcus hajekii]